MSYHISSLINSFPTYIPVLDKTYLPDSNTIQNIWLFGNKPDNKFSRILSTHKTFVKVNSFPKVIFKTTFPQSLISEVILNWFKCGEHLLIRVHMMVTLASIRHLLGLGFTKFTSKTTIVRSMSSIFLVMSLTSLASLGLFFLAVYNMSIYNLTSLSWTIFLKTSLSLRSLPWFNLVHFPLLFVS